MDEKLTLRFTGKDLVPSNVRGGKLGELLASVEELICAVTAQNHPELSKDNLKISLSEISEGSLRLSFDSHIPEVVIPAFITTAKAIYTNVEILPPTAYPHLDNIIKFLRLYDAQADFIVSNGKDEVLTTLTADFALPQPSYLYGETILYGEIVRVGGVDPKVEIKSISGELLFCSFDKSLASQLGNRLYQVAGLYGQAKWDARTRTILEFKVTGLSEYIPSSITEAMKRLSKATGKYYKNITDVNGYISDLRGGA